MLCVVKFVPFSTFLLLLPFFFPLPSFSFTYLFSLFLLALFFFFPAIFLQTIISFSPQEVVALTFFAFPFLLFLFSIFTSSTLPAFSFLPSLSFPLLFFFSTLPFSSLTTTAFSFIFPASLPNIYIFSLLLPAFSFSFFPPTESNLIFQIMASL